MYVTEFVTLFNDLILYVQSDSEDDDSNGSDAGKSPRTRKAEKQRLKKLAKQGKLPEPTKITLKDPSEANNIYAKDRNMIKLIKKITSNELLNIADKFDQYPSEEVDLHQFVKIMHAELADTKVAKREDFIE